MSAGFAAARGQGLAETNMTLTLHAYSPGDPVTVDGKMAPGWNDEGTTRGKVQSPGAQGGDPVTQYLRIGDVDRPVITSGLQIPVSAAVPVEGKVRGQAWEYVVDAVGPSDDPALLGRRYMVVSCPAKSYLTARRLDVVEVS